MRTIHLAFAIGLLLALGGPAVAGVADSPLPTLGGQKSKHVFMIPGVISHGTLATVIVCTSLKKTKDLLWGVEIFSASGGDPEDSILDSFLNPGDSEAIATEGTTYAENVIGLSDSNLARSARVVATSRKLVCSATVLERQNTGLLPGAGWSLPVIKKTNQKGV